MNLLKFYASGNHIQKNHLFQEDFLVNKIIERLKCDKDMVKLEAIGLFWNLATGVSFEGLKFIMKKDVIGIVENCLLLEKEEKVLNHIFQCLIVMATYVGSKTIKAENIIKKRIRKSVIPK